MANNINKNDIPSTSDNREPNLEFTMTEIYNFPWEKPTMPLPPPQTAAAVPAPAPSAELAKSISSSADMLAQQMIMRPISLKDIQALNRLKAKQDLEEKRRRRQLVDYLGQDKTNTIEDEAAPSSPQRPQLTATSSSQQPELKGWAISAVPADATGASPSVFQFEAQGFVAFTPAPNGTGPGVVPPGPFNLVIPSPAGTETTAGEIPSKRARVSPRSIVERELKMHYVRTIEGNGMRQIEGILHKYEHDHARVRIACFCHAAFHNAADFVKHAGGDKQQVKNPLKYIVICPPPWLR